MERDYDLELSHIGDGRIKMLVDDTPAQDLPAGTLKSGGLFILFHTEYIARIDDLVIEAELDEALLAKARSSWIAERLAVLGL